MDIITIFQNESFTIKITLITVILASSILIFEGIPLLLGKKTCIKKNTRDFLVYILGGSLYGVLLGTSLIYTLQRLGVPNGLLYIKNLNPIIQILYMFLTLDLLTYGIHRLVHIYNIPILTKAHLVHHTVRNDMDWANSRREGFFMITTFVIISILIFYFIFNASYIPILIVMGASLFLDLVSHYRYLFTIPHLSYIFLFPKDHIHHHTTRNSGPYGVHSSLFDTIFNTRNT